MAACKAREQPSFNMDVPSSADIQWAHRRSIFRAHPRLIEILDRTEHPIQLRASSMIILA